MVVLTFVLSSCLPMITDPTILIDSEASPDIIEVDFRDASPYAGLQLSLPDSFSIEPEERAIAYLGDLFKN